MLYLSVPIDSAVPPLGSVLGSGAVRALAATGPLRDHDHLVFDGSRQRIRMVGEMRGPFSADRMRVLDGPSEGLGRSNRMGEQLGSSGVGVTAVRWRRGGDLAPRTRCPSGTESPPHGFKLANPAVAPTANQFAVCTAIMSKAAGPLEILFFSKVRMKHAVRSIQKMNYKVTKLKIDR